MYWRWITYFYPYTPYLRNLSRNSNKTLPKHGAYSYTSTGVTGFDSGQKGYVSMQSVDGLLYNLRHQKFNWRK